MSDRRSPRGRRRRILAVGLVAGGALAIALTFAAPAIVGAAGPLIGGLGLNALIVGVFVAVREPAARLRRRLPPWLPW